MEKVTCPLCLVEKRVVKEIEFLYRGGFSVMEYHLECGHRTAKKGET